MSAWFKALPAEPGRYFSGGSGSKAEVLTKCALGLMQGRFYIDARTQTCFFSRSQGDGGACTRPRISASWVSRKKAASDGRVLNGDVRGWSRRELRSDKFSFFASDGRWRCTLSLLLLFDCLQKTPVHTTTIPTTCSLIGSGLDPCG